MRNQIIIVNELKELKATVSSWYNGEYEYEHLVHADELHNLSYDLTVGDFENGRNQELCDKLVRLWNRADDAKQTEVTRVMSRLLNVLYAFED